MGNNEKTEILMGRLRLFIGGISLLIGLYASVLVGSYFLNRSVFSGVVYLVFGWEIVVGVVMMLCYFVFSLPIETLDFILKKGKHETAKPKDDDSDRKAA